MTYRLEGDASSLEDIARDMKTLRMLRKEALRCLVTLMEQQKAGQNPTSYDRFITWADLERFAHNAGYKPGLAKRLWNTWLRLYSDQAVSLCMDEPHASQCQEKGFYLGSLCGHNLRKESLQRWPNLGELTLKLYEAFIMAQGCCLEGAPPNWEPPSQLV